uniref:Capsid protein n=1 Tax=Papio cynocephalus associated smacovirus TaxID=2213168 RepID=A0A455R3P7_9VIRU|nr:capsid protein [Papio cynocephalus associated smacovirus]
MVMVRVSETYDLSTNKNKMGIVGIHTPRSDLITRMYAGLIQNFKYARFVSCDVQMACASMLPADPLQIGVSAGDIAPQDMFNPILYKAVSNDGMNNILSYLQNALNGAQAFSKNSVIDVNDPAFKNSDDELVDQFSMYYALLSDSDGWRKAMPQAGLTMKGLYPIVYSVVSGYGGGNTINIENPSTGHYGLTAKDGEQLMVSDMSMRGPSMRMPRMPTTVFTNTGGKDVFLTGDATVASNLRNVPETYVGLIVLPPAKLNQLYYRLKVTWTVEFSECRSMTDILNWRSLANLGAQSYGTDYTVQSQSMTNSEAVVDTANADIKKIMEGSA